MANGGAEGSKGTCAQRQMGSGVYMEMRCFLTVRGDVQSVHSASSGMTNCAQKVN